MSQPANSQRSPFSLVEVNPDEALKPTNTQLFENSGLAQHTVTHAAATDPDRLFSTNGDMVDPNLAILDEKPEHRLIVYLKAQGFSNKEVSDKTGYTQPWVSQITRQPWFRLRLVQELREAGVDQIQQVLKSNALDSIFTLVDLRDDPQAPKSVRKAAADSLLDRYLGKPTQKFADETPSTPSTEELHNLDKQIAEIDSTLKNEN